MSPKSAQPDDNGTGKKGKKGKKGRRGKNTDVTTVIIEEKPDVPPFGISVLFATVLSIPSIINYTDGSMAFDAMILRYLLALVVSWALVNLVYGVAKSFRQPETTVEATTIDHVTSEMLGDNYRVPSDSGYLPPQERTQQPG